MAINIVVFDEKHATNQLMLRKKLLIANRTILATSVFEVPLLLQQQKMCIENITVFLLLWGPLLIHFYVVELIKYQ